jgi:hypothetical protein
MSTQIDQLRAQFNGLSTDEKGQFVDKLKSKLQGSNNTEYIKFLDECAQKHNSEVNSASMQSDDQGWDGVLDFAVRDATAQPRGFIETMHTYGRTSLFLVGIILFTAGNLFAFFSSFGAFSVFSLALLALPITGLWLIYFASRNPKTPEKSLSALILFKISAVIDICIKTIMGLGFLIFSLYLFSLFSSLSEISQGLRSATTLVAAAAFALFIIGGVTIAIAILYFKATWQVLGEIRSGISTNHISPLPSIKLFTVFTYITVGLSALESFSAIMAAFASGMIGIITSQLPMEIAFMSDMFLSRGLGVQFSALFTLTGLAGVIVCVKALNVFNNELITSGSK